MNQFASSNKVNPWKTLSSAAVLDTKWMPIRKDTVQLPSGRVVEDYFVWESPHIVQVIPVTPEGKFVMVRQYRHAVDTILRQFPAGAVDKGEDALHAARRELKEETGYTSDKIIHLATMTPYGTKMSGPEDVFIALDATFAEEPEYDDQEETEVLVMTPQEVAALLDNNKLQGATTFSGIALAFRYLKLPLF